MLDTMTIALSVLALISLVVAAIAIGWLSILSNRLSALGKKVLASEDIGRVIHAADKTESFESRLTDCQNKADENQNQLAELQTKQIEIIAKQRAVQQTIDGHTADLASTSEKTTSFERRFNEFENNTKEKSNQLMEIQTKANEFTSKLKSIEQAANNNDAGLAETDRIIKALTDEIESLKEFRTTIEKTHSLIQAAFADTQTSTPFNESQEISQENNKLEKVWQEPLDEPKDEQEPLHEPKDEQEPSQESMDEQEPKNEQEESEDQKTPRTYKFEL